MKAVLSYEQASTLGSKIRKHRMSQMLNQAEVAKAAGVLEEEVDLLESGLPVRLDVRRRVLKVLLAVQEEHPPSPRPGNGHHHYSLGCLLGNIKWH